MRAAPEREQSGPKINEAIRAREVRLIGADGENVGVVSTQEAITRATEAGLDLVEVSPDANPPVCKILDFGKFKYQEQKKAAEARKRQKIVEIKEIKMRPSIDDHDYDVKMRSMKRFFDDGDKVKVTLRFRGREMAHQELGYQLLQRVKADIDLLAKVEAEPRLEGRQMVMVLAPRSRDVRCRLGLSRRASPSIEDAVALLIDDLLGFGDREGDRIIGADVGIGPDELVLLQALGRLFLDASGGLVLTVVEIRRGQDPVAIVFDRFGGDDTGGCGRSAR
jgi:translation initiation factor IF-3